MRARAEPGEAGRELDPADRPAAVLLLAGCAGPQSALDPAGRPADTIEPLFLWMAVGAFVIWAAVIALGAHAIRADRTSYGRSGAWLVIAGGAVVPTIVLGGLLGYGLAILPGLVAPAPEGALRVTVTGEQWWWRVRYPLPGGGEVELANEIRLPVGRPVEFRLESANVIHAFWIPSLGGKVDMIPGRVTRLTLEPTRTGVLRAACAEYCGASHALMGFYTVVSEPAEFDRWLAAEAAPAEAPGSPLAVQGEAVFQSHGCGACHAIRGTPADGAVGPDLTHVGSRLSLGAGTLPNEIDDFVRWVERTDAAKPGVHMPAFGMLPEEQLAALAAYLDGLE